MKRNGYCQELLDCDRELSVDLRNQYRETKGAGRSLRSAIKNARKCKGKHEAAVRACQTLPKPWYTYRNQATGRYSLPRYANKNVAIAHSTQHALTIALQKLDIQREFYEDRFQNRSKIHARREYLRVYIPELRQFAELETKREEEKAAEKARKVAKASMSKWHKVTETLSVERVPFKTYIRNVKSAINTSVENGSYVVVHASGWARFKAITV